MLITIEIEEIPYVLEQLIATENGLDGEANGVCNATWIPVELW